jgi:putative ABC transport system ATP-binding protein
MSQTDKIGAAAKKDSQDRSSENGVYRGTVQSDSIITVRKLSKTYWRGKERLEVLKDVDLNVATGAFEALMGPSGSGKSTLLNLIAGLDRPTSGTVVVGGTELGSLSESGLARWRSTNVGFVFQNYNLIPVLTAAQNVELPLLLTKLSGAERKKRALTALKVVGLSERASHRPDQLSGGQQQRTSIARAIVTDPKIIVADEPTGDLDRDSAEEILGLLEKLNREFEKTIIMVTHDPHAAERAGIVRKLDKGALQ